MTNKNIEARKKMMVEWKRVPLKNRPKWENWKRMPLPKRLKILDEQL